MIYVYKYGRARVCVCVYNNIIYIYKRTGKRRFYWPMISTGRWQMTSAQISATAAAVKSGNRCVRLLQTPLIVHHRRRRRCHIADTKLRFQHKKKGDKNTRAYCRLCGKSSTPPTYPWRIIRGAKVLPRDERISPYIFLYVLCIYHYPSTHHIRV